MRIKSIRIENFRSFKDCTVDLNPYSCFVGPNGVGKSNVLAALNVFFQENSSSATSVSKLIDEDYFNKQTDTPIRITLVFHELAEEAQAELSDYVRQGELVVSAEADFDSASGFGSVRHYGQRMGMEEFGKFFEAMNSGKKATELNNIYENLRTKYQDLPGTGNVRSKDAKAEALREYETEHPEKCVLIPSEDNFYGFNSTGKLAKFVQWVYVPAVKDAAEESLESKNTALGQLISRAVRARTNFDEELDRLKKETLEKYSQLLINNQKNLTEISKSLENRLETWVHSDVRLAMEWQSDPEKSVTLQQPVAGIKTGEGDFVGSIARMGHGLQRSYLLALLQELANSGAENAPTLILGIEEPELYQHPPQARHMADVFQDLSTKNNQIIATTHSPLFLSGKGFENTRVVRCPKGQGCSVVKGLKFDALCKRIRKVRGDDQDRPIEGLIAKIHQVLQPNIAEMFFTRIPVLVEGLEDVSYITTELHLSDLWAEFRRLGCHLIPVNGKDKLIQPLAIARELNLKVFTIFDADGDVSNPDKRRLHKRDNSAIMALLGVNQETLFPEKDVIATNYAIWETNLGKVVEQDFGDNFVRLAEKSRLNFAQEKGLKKNDLFIADFLTYAKEEGITSPKLKQVCDAILDFARLGI